MASYTNILITSENALTPAVTGTDARDKAVNLADIVKSMAGGVRNGSMIVHVDGVRASGTVTVVYAKLIATDTITIGGTTLTCKTTGANGTTEFTKVTDATATAASLVSCINANTTLNKFLTASSALGVVTIVCKQCGLIGNCVDMVVAANDSGCLVLSAARLASGTSGTVSNLSFGL